MPKVVCVLCNCDAMVSGESLEGPSVIKPIYAIKSGQGKAGSEADCIVKGSGVDIRVDNLGQP